MTDQERIAALEAACADKDRTIAALATANAALMAASTEAVRRSLSSSAELERERRKAITVQPRVGPRPMQQAPERTRLDPEKEFKGTA